MRGLVARRRQFQFLFLALIAGLAMLATTLGPALPSRAAGSTSGEVFASSDQYPDLILPEGLTSWHNKMYVGTYNVVDPTHSRIMVFNAQSGHLLRELGGGNTPGDDLISNGALLGLTIDPATGDLFCSNNFSGNILRIQNPGSAHPRISIYASYPQNTSLPPGPEDLAFNAQGALYASDSNNGRIYEIPPGGGSISLVVGPAGSGAQFSDGGLFAQAAPGLAPNSIAFSLDYRTLYVTNTDTDSIIGFDVAADGQLTGARHVIAQNLNNDLELYPTGFEAIIRPDTHIGPSATTPLNGVDGLAVDVNGNLWAAATMGDNVSEIDPHTGQVLATYGSSESTQHGLLNAPASLTFVGDHLYTTNLGIFSFDQDGNPLFPFTVVGFDVGVTGAGGNGNR
jgi:DNA-binding beta-propeller fold protein YncE